MQLYKIEFYKICSKKIFIAGVISIAAVLLFFFRLQINGEQSTVNGVTYTGREAISVDRKIVKEFRGVLTDEKVKRIVENYGFPGKVVENCGYFQDANYLNRFVTDYLSDGYMMGWEEGSYKIPTCTYPIKDTELGRAGEMIGEDILLEYTRGWTTFLEVLQMGMILGSILILSVVSSVFAEESQNKTLPLLFTAKEGKRKDIFAKLGAACTVAGMIYFAIVGLDLLLCNMVYGLDGWDSLVGTSFEYYLNVYRSYTMIHLGSYVIMQLFMDLLAQFCLCAVTLWISASVYSSFHAVVIAAICWGAPVMIRMFFGGAVYLFVSGTPVFLILNQNTLDCYQSLVFLITVAVVVFWIGLVRSYCKYKKI